MGYQYQFLLFSLKKLQTNCGISMRQWCVKANFGDARILKASISDVAINDYSQLKSGTTSGSAPHSKFVRKILCQTEMLIPQ